jgi:hypothetical protein
MELQALAGQPFEGVRLVGDDREFLDVLLVVTGFVNSAAVIAPLGGPFPGALDHLAREEWSYPS